MKNIAVVQTGGCSAVINSTLAGMINNAKRNNYKLYGLLNGFEGLLQGKLVDLIKLSPAQLLKLRVTPAMFLGSSRMLLTEELVKVIPQKLQQLDIDNLILIGGNGTMYAANLIHQAAQKQNIKLTVIGSPKTVDNDIVGLDYSPGFGSAAKYIAQIVRDISFDLASMKTFEQIRIIEVMGRSVGWLAASSFLAKRKEEGAPHLIYLPEYDFAEEDFLQEVEQIYRKYKFGVIVVGEGIHDKNGVPIGTNPFANIKQASKIYGGAATYLAHLVSERLNLKARAQDLTMAQRCCGALRSNIDEALAYKTGLAAILALKENHEEEMVYVNIHDQEKDYHAVALVDVGGKERKLPLAFYDFMAKQPTAAFSNYLLPIVGDFPDTYLSLDDLKLYE